MRELKRKVGRRLVKEKRRLACCNWAQEAYEDTSLTRMKSWLEIPKTTVRAWITLRFCNFLVEEQASRREA